MFSFNDVENYVEKLKSEYNPLRRQTSILVEKYNESLKKESLHIPLDVKYYSIKYVCKHYGNHRNRSKNIRKNQKVLANGCTYHVEFKYNRHLQRFIISSQDLTHNHDVGPELYNHYSENRRISPVMKEQVLDMLKAGAKVSLVKRVVEAKTGKVILKQDLLNIRRAMKSKLEGNVNQAKKLEGNIKQAIKSNPEVEEVAEIGKNFLSHSPGSEFIMVTDVKKQFLEMIFIQTKTQKMLYEAFGEMVQLNAIYQVSISGMVLFDFIVEDNNGKSIVVGYCFVSNAEKNFISMMLKIFKQANPSWNNSKVVVLDKDFAEISAVKEAFEGAKILLSVVPMMKTMVDKLKKVEGAVKEEIFLTCKRLIYASTEAEIDSYLRKLEAKSAEFYKYFVDNWMSCKEKWSKVYQPNDGIILVNSTTNPVETNHTALKDFSTMPLSLTIKVILELNNSTIAEFSQNEFKQKLFTHVSARGNQHEDVKSYFAMCTNYASELIAAEHETSLKKNYEIVNENDDIRVVSTSQVYTFDDQFTRCSCEFNIRKHLPCHHLFYIRNKLSLPSYAEGMVSRRFQNNYFAGFMASKESAAKVIHKIAPKPPVTNFLISASSSAPHLRATNSVASSQLGQITTGTLIPMGGNSSSYLMVPAQYITQSQKLATHAQLTEPKRTLLKRKSGLSEAPMLENKIIPGFTGTSSSVGVKREMLESDIAVSYILEPNQEPQENCIEVDDRDRRKECPQSHEANKELIGLLEAQNNKQDKILDVLKDLSASCKELAEQMSYMNQMLKKSF